VWHVLPSTRILVGGAVVIGSGLYLIWRERSARPPLTGAAVMEVPVAAGQNVAPISDR